MVQHSHRRPTSRIAFCCRGTWHRGTFTPRSPRATINLAKAARAYAFLHGRAYVTPQDVKSIAPWVLRHRIIPTYEAEAEDIATDQIIQRIFDSVPVP